MDIRTILPSTVTTQATTTVPQENHLLTTIQFTDTTLLRTAELRVAATTPTQVIHVQVPM